MWKPQSQLVHDLTSSFSNINISNTNNVSLCKIISFDNKTLSTGCFRIKLTKVRGVNNIDKTEFWICKWPKNTIDTYHWYPNINTRSLTPWISHKNTCMYSMNLLYILFILVCKLPWKSYMTTELNSEHIIFRAMHSVEEFI